MKKGQQRLVLRCRRRKKGEVVKMPAVVAERPTNQGLQEDREYIRMLHDKFSRRIKAAGITHEEVSELTRKALLDVRKARRSDRY